MYAQDDKYFHLFKIWYDWKWNTKNQNDQIILKINLKNIPASVTELHNIMNIHYSINCFMDMAHPTVHRVWI